MREVFLHSVLTHRASTYRGGEIERDNRLRALRLTRPQTAGYVGGCDQEEGQIESRFNTPRFDTPRFEAILP